MEKSLTSFPLKRKRLIKLLIMRTAILIFLLCSANTFAIETFGQNKKINFKLDNASFQEAVSLLQKESEYYLFYKSEDIPSDLMVSANLKNSDINKVMEVLLKNTTLSYKIVDKYIAIVKKDAPEIIQQIPQNKITGTVKDDKGLTIPGVSVYVKGSTSIATVTDLDGNFSLEVPDNAKTLVFSFIGMKTIEYEITADRSPLTIVMTKDQFNLEEVIITGYGSVKKEAYAGSASMIKMDKLANIPISNLGNLLQGSASGVQVTNSSGQPGAETQIRIRGIGSFNASNDPLYVIDGVPIISGNLSSLGTNSGLDILSTISPSDIESISVIKDAAAASLYGSRAANGVIIINTKKGASGAAKINFKSEFGFSDFAVDYRPFMSGDERRETIYEGLVNEGLYYKALDQTAATTYANDNIDKYAKLPWTGVWTDWKDILFRKSTFKNNEVSVTG